MNELKKKLEKIKKNDKRIVYFDVNEGKVGDVLFVEYCILRKGVNQFASAERVFYFKNGIVSKIFVEFSELRQVYQIKKNNLLDIKTEIMEEKNPEYSIKKSKELLHTLSNLYIEKRIKKEKALKKGG